LFLQSAVRHLHLRSSPTRRSSDLPGMRPLIRLRLAAATFLLAPALVVAPGAQAEASPAVPPGTVATVDLYAHHQLFDTTSPAIRDRKSTRLNSSHQIISYAVFRLK